MLRTDAGRTGEAGPMIRVRTAIIGLALTAATIATIAAAAPDPRIAAGHDLAVQRCSSCHAVESDGASPEPAAPPFRTLGHSYPVESLDEALAEGISVGHPGMPDEPWEPADIDSFIAYLKSISEAQASADPPRSVTQRP